MSKVTFSMQFCSFSKSDLRIFIYQNTRTMVAADSLDPSPEVLLFTHTFS
jgi:hypothetical protein